MKYKRLNLPDGAYLLEGNEECRLCLEVRKGRKVVEVVEEAYPDREAALEAYRRFNSYIFNSFRDFREV